LHEHNEASEVPHLLGLLAGGAELALVSDAGTPLLADPGFRLVRACRESGFRVTSVPGPSAPVAALSACGLPPAPYTFLGFLPRQKGQAKKLLSRHAATGATLIFFERKDRLTATLSLAAEVLGDREFALCRELTKVYEEFILGRLGRLSEVKLEVLGEVTVVIGPEPVAGATALADAEADLEMVLAAVMAEEKARGCKPREVARRVALRVPGMSVKDVYERLGHIG
jgi:16S rRNA (cytidine1402-2'-O)-methyltransferase